MRLRAQRQGRPRQRFELLFELFDEFELELLDEFEFELLDEFELELLDEFEFELLDEFELELELELEFELLDEFELELELEFDLAYETLLLASALSPMATLAAMALSGMCSVTAARAAPMLGAARRAAEETAANMSVLFMC